MRTTNSAPPSGRFSAWTLPPCAAVSRWTITSPRPSFRRSALFRVQMAPEEQIEQLQNDVGRECPGRRRSAWERTSRLHDHVQLDRGTSIRARRVLEQFHEHAQEHYIVAVQRPGARPAAASRRGAASRPCRPASSVEDHGVDRLVRELPGPTSPSRLKVEQVPDEAVERRRLVPRTPQIVRVADVHARSPRARPRSVNSGVRRGSSSESSLRRKRRYYLERPAARPARRAGRRPSREAPRRPRRASSDPPKLMGSTFPGRRRQCARRHRPEQARRRDDPAAPQDDATITAERERQRPAAERRREPHGAAGHKHDEERPVGTAASRHSAGLHIASSYQRLADGTLPASRPRGS